MHRFARWSLAFCLAFSLASCGEDDPSESEDCRTVLDELEACMTDWCASPDGHPAYCECFGRGEDLKAPPGNEPCTCSGSSFRDDARKAICTSKLPTGAHLDCPGYLQQLGPTVSARCG